MGSGGGEIAFVDVETTKPVHQGQGPIIWEFGAILVDPRNLVEVGSFSTLIRPHDLSLVSSLEFRGIPREDLSTAPTFRDVADEVYNILHGRVWAGHNIVWHDCIQIREAFAEIGRPAPEPKGTIDTLSLLIERCWIRTDRMKMASLAAYFGLGPQKHRSLADVRMNLEVLKYCAAVLFLESRYPHVFATLDERPTAPEEFPGLTASSEGSSGYAGFLDPDEVSIPSIGASLDPAYRGSSKIVLLYKDVLLQLCCMNLRVRFGVNFKYKDGYGNQKLNIVVDAPPSLCCVLDECDHLAQNLSLAPGSISEWKPLLTRRNGVETIRLNIPTEANGATGTYSTEMFLKESSGYTQKLNFGRIDVTELASLFVPGTHLDAHFSLDVYDYRQFTAAGIRLVAKKLIVHC